MLADTGELFDTTHEDNTVFSFELGKGSVIKASEIAVKTMKVGEIAKITCKPEYAYGKWQCRISARYPSRIVVWRFLQRPKGSDVLATKSSDVLTTCVSVELLAVKMSCQDKVEDLKRIKPIGLLVLHLQ